MSAPVALITAASRGIGAGIAYELAARGYKLALLARSNDVHDLARELNGVALQGSVTDLDAMTELVELAMTTFGRIDAVVNNTGHPPRGDLLDITDAEWHAGLDMLLLNVVRTARLVVPIMERQGKGAFVNISTYGAFEPDPDFPVSSSLRAALGSFCKLFADRYAGAGIRMNNVLPGYVENYPVEADRLARVPLQRPAALAEIAKTCAFLLSDDAGYITGQNLRVDGGLGRHV